MRINNISYCLISSYIISDICRLGLELLSTLLSSTGMYTLTHTHTETHTNSSPAGTHSRICTGGFVLFPSAGNLLLYFKTIKYHCMTLLFTEAQREKKTCGKCVRHGRTDNGAIIWKKRESYNRKGSDRQTNKGWRGKNT